MRSHPWVLGWSLPGPPHSISLAVDATGGGERWLEQHGKVAQQHFSLEAQAHLLGQSANRSMSSVEAMQQLWQQQNLLANGALLPHSNLA